ncbi:MAG: universal stress protein, partial [Thermodesulfobacteriota bacterium]
MKEDTMVPSVLIAVDGSNPAMQAVDYAAALTRLIPGMGFDLLYVLPQIPPVIRSEARSDGRMLQKMKNLEAAHRKRGREILDRAREHLLARGIESGRINTKMRARHSGLAKDILNEAESRRHDALIVGRRGLTMAQEIFMGSVSNQLIQ